jgi:hypothetical protein
MREALIIKICFAVTMLLLVLLAVKSAFAPYVVRADTSYDYRLVDVRADNIHPAFSKYVGDGWEPVNLAFYGELQTSPGFLIVRKPK